MPEPKADDALVRAGGIAKKNAKTDPATTGEVVALAFEHPAVEGRTIVRLVETSLDGATNAEMDVLGFAAAGEPVTVGKTRKRALGFPAWALVNHPTKARFALEVMREFRKGATRAKTKPGHARDAFQHIAKKLERSVPAFMPSYWEEVGRVFLAEDAQNLASQAFEKARTAERAYKLKVDEDLRAAAYLEFSAAGAVPAKSLAGYADDLLAAFGPKEAEKRFFELNVQRIKAGTPPWTGMAKELTKLAKAAKRGEEAETAFLTAVLASPSLKKAPPDFWATYREGLMKLAASSDEAKMRIVWLFPEPRSFPKFLPTWLDLLSTIGAVEAVIKNGEAARFLSALTRFVTFFEDWGDREEPIAPAYYGFLERLAPTLLKSGEPVVLESYQRWGDDGVYSPDVLEAALELGLVLAKPKNAEESSISLGDAFVKDPVRLAAHPEYGPLLVSAVGNQFGQSEFETRAKGKKGLLEARRNHLLGVITKLSEGALPAMKDELDTLENCTSAATYAEFPEAAAALEKVDVGRAFARTLRGGIVDELAWPEYEETLAALAGPKVELELHGTRQHPIVRAGRKIVVFEGKKRLEERDIPAIAKEPNHVLYMDGDLLVAYYDAKEGEGRAVWASKAKAPFPFQTYRHGSPDVAPVPGGGVTTGEGVAIRAGDTPAKVQFRHFVTDGTTFWQGRGNYGERFKLTELDPVTGKQGRASWPAFVREASEKADRFALTTVVLSPRPGVDGALTGAKDGLTGYYVRTDEKADEVEVTRLDGKTWTGKHVPDALLDFPGVAGVVAVSTSSSWSDSTSDEIAFRSGDGTHPTGEFGDDKWKSAAFPLLPREGWLDYVSVRDEASSRALREVDDEAARAIVAAATEDDADEDDDITHALAAVNEHLPGVKNEVIRKGIAIVAKVAAAHVAELASLQDRGGGEGATDDAVAEALPHLPTEGYEDGFCVTDMSAVAAAFREKKRGKLTGSRIAWERSIDTFAKIVCFGATRHATSDEHRATLRALAEGIVASGLLGLTVTRAELQVKTGSAFLERPKGKDTWLAQHGEELVFARIVDEDEDEPTQKVHVLARGATFVPPADATVSSSATVTIPDDRAFVAEVLRELDARGPVPFDPTAAAVVAGETNLTAPEAILLLAGLPSFGEYKNDFLGKELRATFDLKQGDASRAKEKLRELEDGQLFTLLAGAGDVASGSALWLPASDPNGSAAALVRTAKRIFGKAVVVREDLVSVVEKECQLEIPVRKALAMWITASEPENKLLTPRPSPVKWYQLSHEGDFFSGPVVSAVGQLVAFSVGLPVGDEYRAAIPALYDRAKKNLEAPDFLLSLGDRYEDDAKKAAAVVDAVGGKKVEIEISANEKREGRDNGTVIAVGSGEESVDLALRTSSLRAHRAAVLPYLVGKGDDDDDGIYGVEAAKAAYYLLSKECEELVESIRSSKAPAGSYELDPRVSAKRTVKELADATGLEENAATLYLQLLALPNPTKKAVMLWNGWKASEYDAAAAALVKKKLVVEGKRERAGREIFLPGGWEKKSRGVSMESYKLGTFDTVSFDEPRVTVAPKSLYTKAYARYAAGEKPGFEDVTKKKKK